MKLVKNRNIFLVCFVLSFCFLFICSNNSFLYSFNDNQDVNWYITMGRGLLEGKIPYRDLFEQKGPIVYFVFALFCTLGNAFRVVFFVEVICLALFLFYSYKIVRKHIDERLSLLCVILLAFLVPTSSYFVVGGGAVEEYFLPILAYMIMCFIEFLHEGKAFDVKRSISWGVWIGVILFSKYTLLFLPIIMLIIIFVLSIFESKKVTPLLKCVFHIMLGFMFVCIPTIMFFVFTGAFKDFVYTYFYINIFLYKDNTDVMYNLFNIFIMNMIPFFIMIYGNFVYMKKYKENKTKWFYTILFASYFLFFLISGNFLYYYLPLVVFLPFGVLGIVEVCFTYLSWIRHKFILFICFIVLTFSCLFLGNGTIELQCEKEDYIHFQIKRDIEKISKESYTLFCYKMWDYGFYNVLGVVPNVKYYANNLILEDSFPQMYEAFRSYIKNGETEFVLVEKMVYEKERDFICENYEYYNSYSYIHYKDNYRSFKMDVVLLVRKEK